MNEKSIFRKKSFRIGVIAALIVVAFGLSIGFAAYSEDLSITGSTSYLSASDYWKIGLSSSSQHNREGCEVGEGEFSPSGSFSSYGTREIDSSNSDEGEYIRPFTYYYYDQGNGSYDISEMAYDGSNDTYTDFQNFTANSAYISNTSISDLWVNFTMPGQIVYYPFQINNYGGVTAYLNSITFNGEKSCTDSSSGNDSDSICSYVDFSVVIGNIETREGMTDLSGKAIEPGEHAYGYIKMSVDSSSELISALDGNGYYVYFPDVVFTLDSSD